MGEAEEELDRRCRIHASISFAVLLLGVGVPLWWHTTAVPRVSIPYYWIENIADLDVKIGARLLVGCFDLRKARIFALDLEELFNDRGVFKFEATWHETSNSSLRYASSSKDLEAVEKSYDLKPGDILILEVPDPKDHVLVSSGRVVYFSERTDVQKIYKVIDKWILKSSSLILTDKALTDPMHYSLDVENRRRFPPSPSYDVLLTVVNPEPETLNLQNNVLLNHTREYIGRFLDKISVLADFEVKSQWLYLLKLSVKPKLIRETDQMKRHFSLREEVLPHIITPLEKKLASQVSLSPTINLVLYAVPCEESPLYIYHNDGKIVNDRSDVQSFHSPRWGGIVIANPPSEVCEGADKVFELQEEQIAKLFLRQLKLMLGVSKIEEIDGASIAPLIDRQIRDWEIDGLLRVRTVEQLTSSKLTLQSLAQLLREISNIVITETVGDRILRALQLIEKSAKLLEEGDVEGGFIASKEAFVISEAAFTDPSLLALLYFPDDQKYAVYIPLFLPVMIPVLFSLRNIKSYFFS